MSADESINKQLKNALGNVEVQPLASSFKAIQSKMAKKKRRRLLFVLFFGAAGISILALFLIPNIGHDNVEVASKNKRVTTPSPIASENKNVPPAFPKREVIQPNKMAGPASVNELPGAHTLVEATISKMKNQSASDKYKLPSEEKSAEAQHTQEEITLSGAGGIKFSKKQAGVVNTPEPLHSGNLPDKEEFTTEKMALKKLVFDDSTACLSRLKSLDLTTCVSVWPMSKDSILKPKRLKWLIGVHANPQLTATLFSENKKRDPAYDSDPANPFSKAYLENRRQQNRFRVDYAFGLQLGLQYDKKWEFWLGVGLQRFSYRERPYSGVSKQNLSGAQLLSLNNAKSNENGFKNSFTYLSGSLSADRIIEINPFLKMKLGLGFKLNNLLFADYILVDGTNFYKAQVFDKNGNLRNVLYSIHLNTGIIRDLNKRIQLRLSPGLYYTPTSMFGARYVITQRLLGAELECKLIYKFR